jgi:hypothetical protein
MQPTDLTENPERYDTDRDILIRFPLGSRQRQLGHLRHLCLLVGPGTVCALTQESPDLLMEIPQGLPPLSRS